MARKKTSFGLVFWLASVALILLLVLVNKPVVEKTIEATGIDEVLNRVFTDRQVPASGRPSPEKPIGPVTKDEPRSLPDPQTTPQPTAVAAPKAGPTPPPKTEPEVGQPTAVPRPAAKSEPPARTTLVYFARVGRSGLVEMVPTPRALSAGTSPLTDAVRALIAGPDRFEADRGLQSLIPAQTRLLSAVVKDGTATLDFNEDFRFNPYGREGSEIQLRQIVYTCLEFRTVVSVRILIEGKAVEYLGSEGFSVARPLDRDSFGS